jgi:hypothetical protein
VGYEFININYWCEIAKSSIHRVVVENYNLNLSPTVLFGNYHNKNVCGLLNPCKSQANSVKNPFQLNTVLRKALVDWVSVLGLLWLNVTIRFIRKLTEFINM